MYNRIRVNLLNFLYLFKMFKRLYREQNDRKTITLPKQSKHKR
jgi:hypothetical protein